MWERTYVTAQSAEAVGPQVPELVVAADLMAVGTARSFVRAHCHALGFAPDPCDTAVLLTSEVVTNAILHGRSGARVRVHAEPHRLVVEVADDNSRYPQLQAADPDALDGRGLTIVEMLAARWGMHDDPFGKTVWFEVQAA